MLSTANFAEKFTAIFTTRSGQKKLKSKMYWGFKQHCMGHIQLSLLRWLVKLWDEQFKNGNKSCISAHQFLSVAYTSDVLSVGLLLLLNMNTRMRNIVLLMYEIVYSILEKV